MSDEAKSVQVEKAVGIIEEYAQRAARLDPGALGMAEELRRLHFDGVAHILRSVATAGEALVRAYRAHATLSCAFCGEVKPRSGDAEADLLMMCAHMNGCEKHPASHYLIKCIEAAFLIDALGRVVEVFVHHQADFMVNDHETFTADQREVLKTWPDEVAQWRTLVTMVGEKTDERPRPKWGPPAEDDHGRPNFLPFAEALRAEAKWMLEIHANDDTGEAATDARSLRELANRVQLLGHKLAFCEAPDVLPAGEV